MITPCRAIADKQLLHWTPKSQFRHESHCARTMQTRLKSHRMEMGPSTATASRFLQHVAHIPTTVSPQSARASHHVTGIVVGCSHLRSKDNYLLALMGGKSSCAATSAPRILSHITPSTKPLPLFHPRPFFYISPSLPFLFSSGTSLPRPPFPVR